MGGPLALVRNGDRIRLSVANRSIGFLVSDTELAARAAAFTPRPPTAPRGYQKLFLDTVLQADAGADFNFLQAESMPHTIPSARAT